MILRFIFVVRRRWPILVALPVIAAIAAVMLGPSGSTNQKTLYGAPAVISASQAGANQTEVEQALVKATQGQTAAAVAKAVGNGATADDVSDKITTDFDLETYTIDVVAKDGSPAVAAAYAKAFADVFVATGNGGATSEERAALADARKERDAAKLALQGFLKANEAALAAPAPPAVLVSEQDSLQTTLNNAENKMADINSSLRPTDVYEIVSIGAAEALAPSKLQVLANPKFRFGLGLQLGLLAAVLVVIVAERMNPRLDLPDQVEALVDAPVLAMVPLLGRRRRDIIQRVDPDEFRGPFAEAFRTMRAHLDFRANAEEMTTAPRIMVTSATPSEGKSTTAAFLAMSYAESDRRPVVIGGDLRRPTIHRLFGIERVPGLTTRALPGGNAVPLTSIVQQDPVSGVTLVPSGPSVDQVNDVMRDLTAVSEVAQSSGQVVILDTAPVRVANDAIDFLVAVDWVIVVVKAGKSTARSVHQMMHTLRMNGAQVVGVVMVGSVESSDASRDYYSYYAPEKGGRRERRRTKDGDPRKGRRKTDTVVAEAS